MAEGSASKTEARVWQFVNTRAGKEWCWREISGPDDIRESSRLFDDFGVAMLDATRNGFRAHDHTWEIHRAVGIARHINDGKTENLPADTALLQNCCTGGKCKPPEPLRTSLSDNSALQLLDLCLDAEHRCEVRIFQAQNLGQTETAAYEAQLLDRYRLLKAQIFETMGKTPPVRSFEEIKKTLADLTEKAQRRLDAKE
jgi:hypothetical protein